MSHAPAGPLDNSAATPYVDGMHRTTIYLDEALHALIRARAEKTGRTQASVIREVLAEGLVEGRERPYPSSIGRGASGLSDLGDRVDEVLAEGFGADS